MITLKAPIELKARTDFVRDQEIFSERIAGNYSLIGLEIGAEELLHIVNSPPEIYVAEGDATTIVGNTLVSSRNEEKLDIINNMLNRIMLSVNAELTYQDRAYITDALCKIGIRDDRKFMSEVRKMMEESRIEEDFINNYLEVDYEQDNIELRRETLELSREIVERGLESGFSIREENISRNIMRRLQTGAIYQIVANFNKSLNETRINLAEQMISEQENIAKKMLVQSFITSMVMEGAEIVLREEAEDGAGAGEEPVSSGTARDTLTETFNERERSLVSELQSTIRETVDNTYTETTQREGTEIVYRGETAGAGEDVIADREAAPAGLSSEYISANIYERELATELKSEVQVNETINAAVLLDIVKNLYHTGYERISRSNAWIEYRGALFHSSDNTINRISFESSDSSMALNLNEVNTDFTALDLDYTEFEELSEIQENEGNIELIENQIREINEQNMRNVSRYEQMIETLKKLKPEKRHEGGRERTRREALAALEDEKAILQSLEAGEGEQEARRREVFHEITRLFPDHAAQVFNVIEQYLSSPGAERGADIIQSNVAQAAEEIMRLQLANERTDTAESIPQPEPAAEDLFFKRDEHLTQEELTEILDTYRSRETRQQRFEGSAQDIVETRTINTSTVTNNTQRNLSATELENIEDLVNRGVRSQMGAISEQVLKKLEKRLNNEKSRRGL